jgi:hypothetical protein
VIYAIYLPIEIYEYNPSAPDDLFEGFKKIWNQKSIEKIKEATKIRIDRIQTISDRVNSSEVHSMIDLIKSKDIGAKTMEKCFQFIINSK